jgi:hypothetical protein
MCLRHRCHQYGMPLCSRGFIIKGEDSFPPFRRELKRNVERVTFSTIWSRTTKCCIDQAGIIEVVFEFGRGSFLYGVSKFFPLYFQESLARQVKRVRKYRKRQHRARQAVGKTRQVHAIQDKKTCPQPPVSTDLFNLPARTPCFFHTVPSITWEL